MFNWVTIGILIIVILYQGYVNFHERKRWEKQAEDLLNRLMAVDYGSYVQGKSIMLNIPSPPKESVFEGNESDADEGFPVV